MTNLSKKVIAAVTTVTCAVWMIPGSVGAVTADELQNQINSLLATLATLQAQLSTVQGGTTGGAITGVPAGFTFTTNLSQGASSNDVKYLQIVLNSNAATQIAATGSGSPGNETMYFGALTKAAVVKFQDTYAADVLTPVGLTAGTGFVGASTRAKLNALLGTGTPGGPITPVPTGTPSIALDLTTPAGTPVALNAQDAVATKIKVMGGTSGVTISKVVITRGGIAADADVASIKLYDGATQIGSTQALNTLTHKASFTSLNWKVAAGETKTLTVKVSIGASGTATVGDAVKLGISVATDVVSDVTLGGTFPIWGNAMTIAGISVGNLDVDVQASPAAANILSGSVEQEIAAWKFTASSTEGFTVNAIKISHVGSATRDDIKNLKLKVNGVQIGSTVAQLDSQNQATFDLSAAPLAINAGSNKIIYAYADVAEGIWTSRTAQFEITQYSDIVANGSNSGGVTTVTYSTGTAYTRQTGAIMTITQGALTVNVDASLNPAAQTYVKGTENRLFSAFKFSTGSTEGVRVTKLKLKINDGTGNYTDINNVTLWDGSTQIAGPASVIGSYVTFGANTVGYDATGLFDVAVSSVKTIQVKADIPSGATTAHTVDLDIAAAGDVYADGLSSKYDVPSASITLTSGNGNAHTISANGALTASKAADTPAAQTYVKGSTGKVFTKINLTAGAGEDVSVSSITIRCYTGDGNACLTGYLTNVKLLKSDSTQYGTTIAAPVATAAFNGTLTVPAANTVTLSAVADVPSTSNATTVYLALASNADITSTGVYSTQELTESGSATGNTMTIAAGTLVVSVAPTPADQTLIIGASSSITGLTFKAGTSEDVRVTYVKLWVSSSGEASTTDLSDIALYDGATRLTSEKALTAGTGTHHYVTYSASDFVNSTGIDLTKGQQKTITVKAALPSTATEGHKVAVGVSSTDDVVAVGLSSNASITPSYTTGPSSATGVNYDYALAAANLYEATLASAGAITVQNDPSRPSTAIQAVGPEGYTLSGVTFHKVYFTASLEGMNVKSITVERSGGRDANFTGITIWDDSTKLGSSQTLTNASTTFSFSPGSYWSIAKGQTKVLTIKGDIAGIATAYGYGSTSGDAPILRLDSFTVEGASSGSATPTGYDTYDLAGNVQYVRQSKPTLAAASLPSSVLSTGEKTLYKWTVGANAYGDIAWKRIAFNLTGTLSGKAVTASSTQPSSDGTIDGIYVNNSGTAVKMINQFKVWDVTNNVQVTGTTTDANGVTVTSTVGAILRADTDASNGYYIVFVPSTEETIGAGTTKTYELRGTVLSTLALTTGDSLLTKLQDLSTIVTTTDYYSAVKSSGTFTSENIILMTTTAENTISFVWSDKNGAGSTHGVSTADWANDYKVDGIPTATLSLTK